MRRFSVGLHFQEVSLEISKTLMLDGVPKSFCHTDEEIKRHFEEAFPESQITDVRFAYNVNKLQQIHLQLQDAKQSQEYCRRNETLGRPSFKVCNKECSLSSWGSLCQPTQANKGFTANCLISYFETHLITQSFSIQSCSDPAIEMSIYLWTSPDEINRLMTSQPR